MSPDGQLLAVTDGFLPLERDLIFVSRSGQKLGSLAIGAENLVFMPDGRLMFAVERTLFLCDFQTGKVTRVASFPDNPLGMFAPSPDGRRLALVLGEADIATDHVWVMDLSADGQASNARQLTTSILDEGLPSWSPDGQYIAVRYNLPTPGIPIPGKGCPEVFIVPAEATAPVKIGDDGDARALNARDENGNVQTPACAYNWLAWR